MNYPDGLDGYPRSILDQHELHQIEVLRPGRSDAPIVLMAAGWNAVFLYRGLAAGLPESVAVALLVAYPYPGQENTPILDAVEERTRGLDALLSEHRELVEGRPVVVLGYSRGGLVAHELSSRLAASGCEVVLEVMIDTLFPGEERHKDEIVSRARRSKYRTMMERREYAGIARELGRKAADRARRGIDRIGSALSSSDGGDGLPEWETSPLTTADYDPPRVGHRGLVYRVRGTPTSWTTERWRDVIAELDEVEVEGRHTPPDWIMSDERIGQITRDLCARLADLG